MAKIAIIFSLVLFTFGCGSNRIGADTDQGVFNIQSVYACNTYYGVQYCSVIFKDGKTGYISKAL